MEERRTSVFENGLIWFGAAVELSVAMPLSWLPLISDYTCEAKEPVKAAAVSAVTYGIVSCWIWQLPYCFVQHSVRQGKNMHADNPAFL